MRIRTAVIVLSLATLLAACDPLEGDFLVVANDCDTELLVTVPGVTEDAGVVVGPGRAWGAIVYEYPVDPISVSTAGGEFTQIVDTGLWETESSELAVDVPQEFCTDGTGPLVAVPMESEQIDQKYHDRLG